MENPYLKGRLYASNDAGSIAHAMQSGFNVVVLVDVGQTAAYPGCIAMSSLLPPPDAISEILNGNLALGIQKYKMYLASSAREEIMVCLIAALVQQPRGILLYAEYDPDLEFNILETVSSFITEAFGIIVGRYQDPRFPAGSIGTPNYIFTMADLLFVNGYISMKNYAMMLPHGSVPSDRACQMILRHMNYGFNTMDECIRACMAMIDNIRKEVSTGKICPIMFVGDTNNNPLLSPDKNQDQVKVT